jgi:hypothetical protein
MPTATRAVILAWLVALLGALAPLGAASYPCQDLPFSSYPYCNAALLPTERAADLVSRMSVTEKVSQMVSLAEEIKALNVPKYNYWSEVCHVVLHVIRCLCNENTNMNSFAGAAWSARDQYNFISRANRYDYHEIELQSPFQC